MTRAQRWVLGVGGVIVVGALGGGAALLRRAEGVGATALSEEPRGVTVTPAHATRYRPSRRFVGTLEPWQRADIGPQLVSAYVETVLVRPGDAVKRGQVVTTLDCRSASAGNRSVAMQARALDERQRALASEAARVQDLVGGGYVSRNEAEQKRAQSAAADAQLAALKAQLAGKTLEVNDCTLRAPFDGEIVRRRIDPGSFVRPGEALLTLIDRGLVRVTADVPEADFSAVAPGAEVELRMMATGRAMTARVSRRAAAANPMTRTLHVEIDVPDPERALPVGTTAEVRAEVGEAQEALEIPLRAATVRGGKASLFLVEEDVARSVTVQVLGEAGKSLFVTPDFPAGSLVVVEGRGQLANGNVVRAKVEGDVSKRPPHTPIPAAVIPAVPPR
ncbi:efflux RND transporter periplasmic adaptor subunit [Chondromyces crocatus]|uniref:efflux RND transporter periplasmic adaptor subunit n=1 Tax=Chondromyces crocatus TaxID=52 RepID=UPI00147017A2|nr:efflux RND transporter periplasmic adaptor subunit [Chondromyces crocatus]